jgi:DNA-binding response OmpR family regulator
MRDDKRLVMTSKVLFLYADDGPHTRHNICVALEVEGFEVVCPTDPRDFLTIAKAEPWDVYMLDNWMPEISGVDLCKKIREFDPQTPIIFYSAAAYERDKREALESGAQAYVVKPVPLHALIEGINAAITSSQSID